MTIGDEHMQSILFIVPFAELADNAKKVIRVWALISRYVLHLMKKQ